jgi:hypothetical protein
MVVHWTKLLRNGGPDVNRGQVYRSRMINATGASFTFVVLLVVTYTKWAHGAYLVFIIMPILFLLMMGVNRYYRDVEKEIEADPTTTFGASGDHAIVLVGRLQKPVLKALDYAIAARHDSIEAVHASIDDAETAKLKKQWDEQNIKIPLRIVESPYRDISMPVIKYIKSRRAEHGSEVVTIYTPQFIVGHWWENLLHNQSALWLKSRLLFTPGVMVTSVPWQMRSSEGVEDRLDSTGGGSVRRGP